MKLITILIIQIVASTSFGAFNTNANTIKQDAYIEFVQVVQGFQQSHSAEDISRAEASIANTIIKCQQAAQANLNYCNDVIENVLSDLDVEISKGNFSPNLKGQITAVIYGGVERSLTQKGKYRVCGGVERAP